MPPLTGMKTWSAHANPPRSSGRPYPALAGLPCPGLVQDRQWGHRAGGPGRKRGLETSAHDREPSRSVCSPHLCFTWYPHVFRRCQPPSVISDVATVPLHDPLPALPFRLPSTFHRGSCGPWAPRERPTRAHAPSPTSQSQGAARCTGGQRHSLRDAVWSCASPSTARLSVWLCSTQAGVSCGAQARPPSSGSWSS